MAEQHIQDTQRTILQLNRLQHMLNEVLEQTGRLFVDASKGNTTSATAHGIRLKQIVPGATRGFHEALDELESELFVAKAVMRRDLVALGHQQTNQSNGVVSENVIESKEDKADVEMADAEDSKGELSLDSQTAPTSTEHDVPEPVAAQDTASDETKKQDSDSISHEAGEAGEAPPATRLQLNTAQPASQSGPATSTTDPGTANTQTVDLDSLFNDSDNATNEASNSQTPSKPIEDTQDTTTPKPESGDQEPDFSFESFNEQNPSDNSKQEDISSLLPGLESYANEGNDLQMGDFNSNDSQQQQSTDDKSQMQQQQQQQQNDSTSHNQGEGDHAGAGQGDDNRDTTFDDIMNFGDFDLGSLGGGDNGFGEGGDSRFDEDFFNVE